MALTFVRSLIPVVLIWAFLADYDRDRIRAYIELIGSFSIATTLVSQHITKRKQDKLNQPNLTVEDGKFTTNRVSLPIYQKQLYQFRWLLPLFFIFEILVGIVTWNIFSSIMRNLSIVFFMLFVIVLPCGIYLINAKIFRPQIIEIDAKNVTLTPIQVIGFPKRKIETYPVSDYYLNLVDWRAAGGSGYRLAMVGSDKTRSFYIEFPDNVNQPEYAKQLGEALNIKLVGPKETF